MAQDSTIYLDSKKYTKENGKWYVHSTGRLYQVDINSMTVKLKENLQRSVLDNVLKNTGIKVVRENELGYIDLELSSSKSFYDWQKHLSQMDIFETVEVNSYGITYTNDPGYNSQYYLFSSADPSINFPYDYGLEDGSTNPVTVAIIDIGIDYNHIDLNMWTNLGKDYIDNDLFPYPSDGSNHGTSVASIVGAITNNAKGIAGIAGGSNSDRGAKIMSLRVGKQFYKLIPTPAPHWGYEDSIYSDVVDDAIIWAVNNGAKVINMSFGIEENIPAVNAAINYAYKYKGCVIVAASGNENKNSISYPANNSYVISVGGILKNWGNYGNYGSALDIVAPAQGIHTLRIGSYDRAYYVSGTSFSSAQVAATAALLLSQRPNLLHSDVKKIIKSTANNTYSNYDTYHDGSGLLNAALAVDSDFEGPQNVLITAVPGTHPIISWSSVSGASQYKIYRANSLTGRYNLSLAGTTTSTSWTDNSYTVAQPQYALSSNYYRVTDIIYGDESITSSEVSCGVNATNKEAVGDDNVHEHNYELGNNYPNPFNPTTRIQYSIKDKVFVKLSVYDILGRKISTLVNEVKEPGKYQVVFDASQLATGIYFYTIQAGLFRETKKMILAK